MVDFFADKMVKQIINDIINDKDNLPTITATWKSMTRLMFKNYPAIQINQWIEEISQEAYDEGWFEKKYTEEEFKKKFVENLKIEKQKKREFYKTNNLKRKLINQKLKITDIAKQYGLDTDKRGRTTCPFHNDSEPSLILNDAKNIFHCFGCGTKGDLITFIQKMEEIKKKNKW